MVTLMHLTRSAGEELQGEASLAGRDDGWGDAMGHHDGQGGVGHHETSE